ncbi:MAG: class I SAM-dependent methyltransferase, partial [Actinomycetota bacterium]|nr:class I SAM-dependent methyltransferase [Actinomycetota bacterium]
MGRTAVRLAVAALAATASVAALRWRRARSSEVSPSASARMKPYDPDAYTPELLAHWISEGERQAAKDRVLLPRITELLGPGRVLELGAGAGQLTLLLRERGFDVVASDYAPFFVEHLASLGVDARRVDASDIAAAGIGTFPNIFAQSITPLITSDPDVIARTYRSLRAALEPEGRLVHIHAQAERGELRATMRAHAALASEAGLRNVRVTRNQLLPSRAYEPPLTVLAASAERVLGARLASR